MGFINYVKKRNTKEVVATMYPMTMCCLLVLGLITFYSFFNAYLPSDSTGPGTSGNSVLSLTRPMITKRSRLDQPRKIFIDLGANCGNTYYRMKNSLVPMSTDTLSSDEWESYLFECNPLMIKHFLNDLVKNETVLHQRKVQLLPYAASDKDGEISFFLTAGQNSISDMPNTQCDPNSDYNPSGASTIYGNALRAGTKITVPTLNFLDWHKLLRLQKGDIVHIKMDIEGAEVDILETFLHPSETTNQLCYWELFWNEYHKNIFVKDTPEYKQHEQFELTFPQRFEAKCGRPLKPNVVG